jgi:hypothetical protein
VRKAEWAWFLFEGEESEALGINGARLHFVRKRTFSFRKWSLAPFIPRGKSNAFLNYIA